VWRAPAWIAPAASSLQGCDCAIPLGLQICCNLPSRLRKFIRRRVPDSRDTEVILKDISCELVEANRLLMPIDRLAAPSQ